MNIQTPRDLKVLLVEDVCEDATLILRELNDGGFKVVHRRVTTAVELRAALEGEAWDLVLCDYYLPKFSGEAALKLFREIGRDIPFIFVSGAIGEEVAVNAMRSGARDYVMKDNLARLAPAVERELREAATRRDITRADALARQSERMYRHLFEALADAAFLFDKATGRIVEVNAAATALMGKSANEIVGLRHADCYEPPLPEGPGVRGQRDAQLRCGDGSTVPVLVSTSEVRYLDRTLVLVLARDITEQRRAAEALRKSEDLYRSVVASMAEGVIIQDAQGRLSAVNASAARILGRPASEMLGKALQDLGWNPVHEDGAAIPMDQFPSQIALASGAASSDAVVGVHWPDGALRWNIVSAQPLVRQPGEKPYSVVTTWHDITARKEAEEALQLSQERFRQVADNIDEVFWLMDATTGQYVYVSPAYPLIWGQPSERLYESPRSWIDAVHPDDRARVLEAQPRRIGGNYEMDYRIVRPDKTVRWVRSRSFSIKNAAGVVFRLAGVVTDITERRQLEERLRQSQKMEAIGQLAGGIAHDFNNLLTIIRMQGDVLLENSALDPQLEMGIQQILNAANRGAALTRQLLTFSRKQIKTDERDLDLGELSSSMVKLLRRIVGENIEVECRFAPALPLVHADPGMMEQVLMNLVINARDAMEEGGRLLISTEAVTIDAAYVAAHNEARVGSFVRLQVADTGCGIAPENFSRIFEPFFTTKPVGVGTGLGLATVFGIVHHHGGWIDVQSKVGAGSTFGVFVPAIAKSASIATAPEQKPQKRMGHETVLVVEDDDIVRALATTALRREGYKVAAVGTGTEALELWRTQGSSIDLLVTDIILPGGLNGHGLARELSALRPGLKVIYTSGYSAEISSMQVRVKAGWDYLPKPYDLQQLSTIIRRRLDAPE